MLQRCVSVGGVLLLAVLAAAVRAESPVFRSLGSAEGLPSQRVYAMAQDPLGALWVATADGLARFDGSSFEVFRHDPNDPASLPANMTQSVYADPQGRVFVGTEGQGLAWREPQGGFRRWQGPSAASAELDVWAISGDDRGQVWFAGFNSGLYRLDRELSTHRHWPAGGNDGLISDTVLSLATDGQGGVWIGTDRGLQYFDGKRFSATDAFPGLPAVPVFKISFDGERLLLATAAGAFRRQQDRFERLPGLAAGAALAAIDDRIGSVWVGRSRGLERLYGGQSELLPGDSNPRAALGAHPVLDLLRDHEGGLWMASHGAGLLRLPPHWQRIRNWVLSSDEPVPAVPQALAFDSAGRIAAAASNGRIERIDPATGHSTLLLQLPADRPDQLISALWFAANGDLWMGHRRGLIRRRADDGQLEHLPADDKAGAPAAGVIDLLLGDGSGGFWLSVNGVGIEHRDGQGRLLRRYAAEQGLMPADSEQLRLDPEGRLWVAGGEGLRRLSADGERFEVMAEFGSERVFGLVFAHADLLWLARRTGLESYQRDAGGWRRTRHWNVLAGVEVGGLAIDPTGLLWASSARGLLRIDPRSGRARRYGVRDGLPGQEFATRPMAEGPNGVFGAVLPEAVLRIDSAEFLAEQAAPQLRAERVRLLRDGETHVIDPQQPLQLDHADREIAFAAQVVSFSDPSQWRYRARLIPYDTDWIELGAQGSRVFNSLPPGDYTWSIAAAGADDQWHVLDGLPVRVAPPWWQHPLSRALQGLMVMGMLWAAYRVLRWRAERRALHAMAESQRRWALQSSEQKSRFLATLAHEIRTPMTGLLGMAELLERSPLSTRQAEQLASMRRCGDVLLRLVNDALDLARIEAGQFELRPRPLCPVTLVQSSLAAVSALAVHRGLTLEARIEPATPAWVLGDVERLQQILLNLLGNALKFTEQGQVVLALSQAADGQLVFTVIDSGPGLNEAEQARLFRRFSQAQGEGTARRHGGTGLGLVISRELAEAMQGSLHLRSQPGVGTEVELRILLAECAPPEVPESPAAPPSADTGGEAVLLVEDDPDAAEALSGQLVAAGFEVSHAAHALAALSLLGAQRFAAAAVDLDLPGMSGLELARILREQNPQLRLLALTARSDAAIEVDVRDAGFDAFLRKPSNIDALAAALRSKPGSAVEIEPESVSSDPGSA